MVYYFIISYQIGWFSFICLLNGLEIAKSNWLADLRKLDFAITIACRCQFEDAVFHQEQLLYCT